jgi:sterol desaturase/sphingolipid hydroxylase (fatty acid hydroxylase superfamily)
MLLSKVSYYADFVIYPLLLLPLGAVVVWRSTLSQQIVWVLACLIGIVGWTLLEYVMHRLILHYIPPFRGMHDMHHAAPTAMVGTPTWLSATLIGGGVLLPLWWQAGLHISSGLTFGLILGYLWYVLVHHAIHRWRAHEGSYLYRVKRRHGQHHHQQRSCNFGVTTACWDHFFGSAQLH